MENFKKFIQIKFSQKFNFISNFRSIFSNFVCETFYLTQKFISTRKKYIKTNQQTKKLFEFSKRKTNTFKAKEKRPEIVFVCEQIVWNPRNKTKKIVLKVGKKAKDLYFKN